MNSPKGENPLVKRKRAQLREKQTSLGKANKSANCSMCKDVHNQWFTLVLIVSNFLTVSVFIFSVSTRKILAHGAIPSSNLPVKSIPPPAPVAPRREIARQQIDVSVPVVSVPVNKGYCH